MGSQKFREQENRYNDNSSTRSTLDRGESRAKRKTKTKREDLPHVFRIALSCLRASLTRDIDGSIFRRRRIVVSWHSRDSDRIEYIQSDSQRLVSIASFIYIIKQRLYFSRFFTELFNHKINHTKHKILYYIIK